MALLVAGSQGLAIAGDLRPVELPLASGKQVTGVVESADASEVVVRLGPEEVRRIPWAQLAPAGVYRARAALSPPADGSVRLRLAELAVELGLHAEARVEYEKAHALGAIDAARLEALVRSAEREAVEVGVRRAMRVADAGDLESALAVARDLRIRFGGAPNRAQIERLVADLLARVKAVEQGAAEDAAALDRVKLEADRTREILLRMTKAAGLLQAGRGEAEAAAKAREKGNVTRARKHAEAGDAAFMEARRHLGRLRRILPPTRAERREVMDRLAELDEAQFALLLASARFFWEQRVYSRAGEFAARASYVDPVHPDLLEVRDALRDVRIRFRMSDVTNARPVVR